MTRWIIKLFTLLSILVLLDYSLGTMCGIFLDEMKGEPFYEIRMREFYKQGSNIDALFLGSSHAYRSFNPFFFDRTLHLNSFNLGSSGQNPTTTYYLLNEALRMGHRIRLVVIETYWLALSGMRTDYLSASYIFYNMRWSKNKIMMMFRGSFEFPSSLKLLSTLFKNRYLIDRYGTSLLRRNILLKDIQDKYVGKGYVENESICSDIELANNDFKDKIVNLSSYRLHYLEKTIELALEHGIQVVLVSTPIPPASFRDVHEYQEAYEIIVGIANKHEVEYIDYNILNRDLQMFSDENFKDDDHLNKSGVEILNRHFIQRLSYLMETEKM